MFKTQADVEEERGELKHAKATLRRQMKARFETLPDHIAQRIDACDDLQRLDATLDRMVQIKSLDEFEL